MRICVVLTMHPNSFRWNNLAVELLASTRAKWAERAKIAEEFEAMQMAEVLTLI